MNIQNIDLNIVIVILLSVFVVIYSTNITKKYPEQILELMKENFVILLFLGLIMYCIHLKKYTISILLSIIFVFLQMNIPLLTETFLDDFPVNEKQKELLLEIEKLKGGDIVDTIQGGSNMEKILGDLKDTENILDELENVQ